MLTVIVRFSLGLFCLSRLIGLGLQSDNFVNETTSLTDSVRPTLSFRESMKSQH